MRKRYLLAGVLSIVLLFSGCNPLAIKPWERKKLYAYYSNDANYVTVKGKITYNNAANEKRYLSLEIDEEQYSEVVHIYNSTMRTCRLRALTLGLSASPLMS